MPLKNIINIGKVRLTLWIVAVLSILASAIIEYRYNNPSTNVSAIKIEAKLNNLSNNTVAIKSKWLINEKSDPFLSSRNIKILQKNKAALYLLENDTVKHWWGDTFCEDVTDILVDTTQTLVNFDNKQIIIRRLINGNKTSALVVTLVDDEKVNKEIFDNENIKLLPLSSTKLFKSSTWHKIDFGRSSFWVQSANETSPPISAYILGWMGIVIILCLTVYWLKRKVTQDNAILINIVGFVVLVVLRVLIYLLPFGVSNGEYFPEYFDSPSFQFLFAPYNMLVNLIVILLQSYLYYTTFDKTRSQFYTLSKFKKAVLYTLVLFYKATMLVYVHWAIVENMYNPSIATDLFNIFSINTAGMVLYLSCGIYFVARLFQTRVMDEQFSKRLFIKELIYSLPIIAIILWLIRSEIHGTWIIAIAYSIGFRTIMFLMRKIKPILVFCAAVTATSVYITSLVVLESKAARGEVANEYFDVLTEPISQKNRLKNKKFSDYSYVFVNEYRFDIENNNQLELWQIMRYIKSDTTIYMGNYVHKITPLKNSSLIISYKYISFLDILSLFCYIYFFIFIVGLAIAWVLHLKLHGKRTNKIGMVAQIQFMVVGLVVLAVATASIVSINYSIDSTHTENRKIINNLLQTVQNSITNYQVNNTNPLIWLQNWYNISGKGLTQNMAVYGTDGRIIIGHPNNFHTYLINSEALNFIANQKNSYYGDTKTKQNQEYTTLYYPIHHNKTKFGFVVISFIDPIHKTNYIPITEELLNIFIVVLFVVIWLSLLSNNLVTKPLRVIQEAMSTINLMRKIPLRKNNIYNDEINSVITVYNNMIDTIKRNNIEIARIERQNAWQDMAKQIAHDIKNPLTPIQLKIQILQRKIENGNSDLVESAKETTDLIMTQIQRINDVVEQFREFAQVGSFKMEKIELSSIIEGEVKMYNQYDNVNVTFDNLVYDDVYVYGDKSQIGRVIGNLCKNAIEALSGIENGDVRVSLNQIADKAIIEVKDNGTGVTTEVAKRIFEPSFTTKTRGSGLGLPICKRIVEQYNGDITFENNDGAGVTFRIIFPIL